MHVAPAAGKVQGLSASKTEDVILHRPSPRAVERTGRAAPPVSLAMIRNRRIRRSAAAALIAVGIVLLVLAPSVGAGLMFFALGILLELVGLALEHRDPPA